ncbi:hypothetical protein CRG98_026546 [Punica granatum]|uniref:Uncharacterized protein n=1 Tax=Punica granatum TaxID=22663 RepID=A0A2I0J9Z7_PUNGR|nr:hypothetical protein CRG98_026546 [Punica granatum]
MASRFALSPHLERYRGFPSLSCQPRSQLSNPTGYCRELRVGFPELGQVTGLPCDLGLARLIVRLDPRPYAIDFAFGYHRPYAVDFAFGVLDLD